MWRRSKDREDATAPAAADQGAHGARRPIAAVTDELCAFLEGRYAEWLAEHGRPVPAWAWLNQAAHAPHVHVALAAVMQESELLDGAWKAARRTIAQEVIVSVADGAELDELRHDVLVPLELDLARVDLVPPLTPRQLVALTGATLDADWR